MQPHTQRFATVLTIFVVLSAAIVMAVTGAVEPWLYGGSSIFGQTFLVGPTAESLVHHQGFLVCTEAMGTPGNPICYRAARMPIASGTLAIEAMMLGDKPRIIIFLKNLVYMIPLWAAAGLILWRARGNTRTLLLCAALLFLPMLMLNYTGSIVNADAEEGYLFGLPGLALALLLTRTRNTPAWIAGFALTLGALYLCKSSMLPAFIVLLCAALVQRSTPTQRVALLLLASIAPIGWATRQYIASGRFSLGTSLDGLNFEKGNNAHFQERYTGVGGVLDQYDDELSRGMHFKNEWQFNDYHLQQGKRFALSHPGYTVRSIALKSNEFFLTFNRHARTQMGRLGTVVVESGFVAFRLSLWASVALALYTAFTGRLLSRANSIAYIAFILAYAAPYIAGFGYMRHLIMMAYPAVIFLCVALLGRRPAPVATAQ